MEKEKKTIVIVDVNAKVGDESIDEVAPFLTSYSGKSIVYSQLSALPFCNGTTYSLVKSTDKVKV